MVGTFYSSVCPMCEVEDTLLTKEKIEEISERISSHVSEEIFRQLEEALASIKKSEEEKTKK